MAKVSPVSIKYIIKAKFIANGTVEKPDVIGAVFGQTEGLLGADMDLRELQKTGKIGRIEVETTSEEGQTEGEIIIPTSLDKTETTLIAAAVETIEKIGPSEAKIKIEGVEDVRSSKREYIIERAKELLKNFEDKSIESEEISEGVKTSARISKLQFYGKEALPAGDLENEEVIVVEGRADVINLLKHGISNVIGMNGTVMPDTIKELGNEKKLTLFVDDDRGGLLIAKNVTKNANISFVVFAPNGKEVEELSGKEILMALRKKISYGEFSRNMEEKEKFGGKRRYREEREERRGERIEREEKKEEREIKELGEKEIETLREIFEDIIGTRGAAVLGKDLELLKKVPLSELYHTLKKYEGQVFAVVVDGLATLNLIKTAEETGVHHLAARNFVDYKTNINLISL